jgi:hypothetical protein
LLPKAVTPSRLLADLSFPALPPYCIFPYDSMREMNQPNRLRYLEFVFQTIPDRNLAFENMKMKMTSGKLGQAFLLIAVSDMILSAH